ncbi:50S ribosomal protein L13 [Candidatus Woesearchaeota archaeon]|jgi:large subunit ribosomal protein L13|nr:50S ribosomal protein L13 [Candidatus Woesearchaeota archaeon]
MRVYDGEGMILGRLCAAAAKDALLGEDVKIVNCSKIIISGDKKKVFANEKAKRARKGYPLKSAKFSRLPDRFVRRTVRGMLPHKRERGRTAHERIMCYIDFPEGLKEEKMVIAKGAKANKLPTLKFTTVGELCTWLGGKR